MTVRLTCLAAMGVYWGEKKEDEFSKGIIYCEVTRGQPYRVFLPNPGLLTITLSTRTHSRL